MTRQIYLLILVHISYPSFGQLLNSDWTKIKTILQAEEYIKKYPKVNGKIFTIESSFDTTEIMLPLYAQKNGFVFKIDNSNFKILQIDSILSFRASYIYLDGAKFNKEQIDSLQNEITSKYKNGTSFLQLVQTYNMDGNFTGDTHWFSENMMVKEFETAIRQHIKGDLFTVYTASQNWHHIVLKIHDNTYIKRLTILRTKNSPCSSIILVKST